MGEQRARTPGKGDGRNSDRSTKPSGSGTPRGSGTSSSERPRTRSTRDTRETRETRETRKKRETRSTGRSGSRETSRETRRSSGRSEERRATQTPRRPRRATEPAPAWLPPRLQSALASLDRPLTAYYLLVGSTLLLLTLGLLMVFSASQIEALQQGLGLLFYFKRQVVAVGIGLVLMLIALRIPVHRLRALVYPLLLVSLGLLVLVLVPGVGVSSGGNTNWIKVAGPFQIQPSEFAKLSLALWGADLLARKQRMRLLGHWRHLLIPLLPMTVLILVLIMGGRDMGTAMILGAIVLVLLWVVGAPGRLFGAALGVAAVVTTLGIWLVPNRLGRLGCVGVTETGPDMPCWQAVHGLYALASGGWFGSGLGASLEKWGVLPAAHTDFIFAVTGEELGLVGAVTVLVLYAAIGYGGLRVAHRAHEPFVRYASAAITTWVCTQAVVNVGAVLGLLPIAGIPLPLFSYGGSALLPVMFAVALLIAFARNEPAARKALAKRGPGAFTRSFGVLRGGVWPRSARQTPAGTSRKSQKGQKSGTVRQSRSAERSSTSQHPPTSRKSRAREDNSVS